MEKQNLIDSINNYLDNVSDESALICIAHDPNSNDGFVFSYGNTELISFLLSNKEYVEDQDFITDMKKSILNIAYNICDQDEEVKDRFLNKLLFIEEERAKRENLN